MRAVNLIPDAERRGGGAGAAGRSGGAAYVLLGGLVVLVVLMGLWALAGRDSTQARKQLVELRQQATDAQRQAEMLAPYSTVNQQRSSTTATVRSLVATRFAWSKTMDAFARVLPADVRLSALNGATAGTASPAAAGGAAAPAAGSAPANGATVQLQGCAPSMARVARLMPRLRGVPGVASVTLGSATHIPGSAGGTNASACRGATFQLTLGFAPATASTATPAAVATAATAASGASGATSATPSGASQ